MKKVFTVLLCIFMISGFAACSPDIPATPAASETAAATGTEPNETATEEPAQTKERIIIMSDIHLCHMSWNGHSSEYRVDKMINDLNEYYEAEPYSNILFLGDYSLDFWQHGNGGSYLNQGISNTANIIKDYFSRLKCTDYNMIAGNHEQYSQQQWKEITGMERQNYKVINGWLFILLDNFAGNLDPDYDSDGTYTQTDVDYIKQLMQQYPDMPVVLCAHYFDTSKESEEFQTLVSTQDRIVCLFCGHDHCNKNQKLSKKWGGKYLFHTGNYSYTKNVSVKECMWGWRTVEFDGEGITVKYYSPKSTIDINGEEYTNEAGTVSEVFIKNPLKDGEN